MIEAVERLLSEGLALEGHLALLFTPAAHPMLLLFNVIRSRDPLKSELIRRLDRVLENEWVHMRFPSGRLLNVDEIWPNRCLLVRLWRLL